METNTAKTLLDEELAAAAAEAAEAEGKTSKDSKTPKTPKTSKASKASKPKSESKSIDPEVIPGNPDPEVGASKITSIKWAVVITAIVMAGMLYVLMIQDEQLTDIDTRVTAVESSTKLIEANMAYDSLGWLDRLQIDRTEFVANYGK